MAKSPTTICLKYNTLAHALDRIISSENPEEFVNVILVKKRDVQYISNILTFIPLDVCKIINTYSFDEITCKCKSRVFDKSISLSYSNACLEFYIPRHTNSIIIKEFTPSNVMTYDSHKYYSISMANGFMEHAYNRKKYIDLPDTVEYDVMRLDGKCNDVKTMYHSSSKYIVAFYDYDYDEDDDECGDVFDSGHEIAGCKIFNVKKYKYDITIAKCLLNGIIKYFKKN